MNDEALQVSVVSALRDEEEHLPALLDALARQTLAKDGWELIFALAPSIDRSRELLDAAIARPDLPELKILDNPMGSAATGLNRALAAARGRFVVRLDGHCEPPADYLERILARLEEGKYACVGGCQRSEGRGPWGRAHAAALLSPAGHGGARFRSLVRDETAPPEEVDTVYLGAWPRGLLLAAGGFDEELLRNQDDELAMRLRQAGGRILLDPALQVIHRPRESLGAILRQYFEYGYWKPRVLRRRSWYFPARHLIPSLVFLWLLSSLMLLVVTLSWGALVLAGFWFLLVLLVSLSAFRKLSFADGLRSLIVASMITPAYGLGFILGTPGSFVSRPRLGSFAGSET